MKTNKTVYLLIVIFSLFIASINQAVAQSVDKYGDLERPNDLGNADFDNFKNSSFDIYFNVGKLDENLKKVETNLVEYKKDKSNINVVSLKNDIVSLNNIGASLIKLQTETADLKGKSEKMIKDAKNFTPKLKAPKAVSNTNKSVTALDKANDKTKVLIDNQKLALATAKELLGDK
jgi:hypothetical protein